MPLVPDWFRKELSKIDPSLRAEFDPEKGLWNIIRLANGRSRGGLIDYNIPTRILEKEAGDIYRPIEVGIPQITLHHKGEYVSLEEGGDLLLQALRAMDPCGRNCEEVDPHRLSREEYGRKKAASMMKRELLSKFLAEKLKKRFNRDVFLDCGQRSCR